MTSVGYATLQVIPSLKGLDRAISGQMSAPMSSAGKQAGDSFSGGFRSVLPMLAGAIAAVGFGGLVTQAMAASDATDKFKQTLGFAGLKTDKIDALTASTRKYADQTVYDLSDIQNITAQLAANAVPNYDKLAEAAGNLNAVSGGNKDTFRSIGMMLTQTAGAGKLTTENWNQLANAIPGASGRMQAAMLKNGAYTGNFRKAMEKGEITAAEFNAALMELGMEDVAKKAATSVTTFEGAWGSLQASLVGGMSDIVTKFKPAITAAMSWLANGITTTVPVVLGAMDAIGAAFAGLQMFAGSGETDGLAAALGISEDSVVFTVLGRLREALIVAQAGVVEFFNGVTGAFTDINPNQSPFILGMFAMGTRLREFYAEVRTIFDQITPALAVLGGAFLATLVPALTGLAAAALPVYDQFAALRMSLAEGMVPILTGVAGVVTTVIIPALAALAAGFVTNVLPAALSVITAMQNVAAVVIPIVQEVVAFVLAKFSEWGPTIAGYMEQVTVIIGGALTIVSGIITAVLGAVQAFWSRWGGTIMAVVGTVFDTVVKVIGNALNIVQGIIKTVTSIMSGDWKGAMTGIGQAASGAVGLVKNVFAGLARIAGSLLTGAGRAIMDGFKEGLEQSWRKVTDFVGGIADWIRANKGPLAYDYKLLQPAGKAIMGGFLNSLNGQMSGVEAWVADVNATVAGVGAAPQYGGGWASPAPDAGRGAGAGGLTLDALARAFRSALDGASVELRNGRLWFQAEMAAQRGADLIAARAR